MAGNRGVTLFVLLLSCWREAKLQPINMTSGPTTDTPPRSKGQEDIPGVFDSVLDESFQVAAPQSYHGLSDNSRLSLGSEDKIFNNEPSIDESYQIGGPEGYGESQFSSGGKKNLQNEQYKKQSILDKILQNIGKTSGHSLQ
ncbi:sperm acrosome-associated protein 7-like isoform X2 [Ailuropoda melanoleuca]|uniref:sperm acrosome-associated protein 7-like isoform X2 n=1 Tax=Ailuropoda melanoleuca TaxID=9646 RepID=UPI00149425D4|nr:sperm acrosome-associated protein 7-like isoform X2 [Ailuropoda melanoleuca]